MRQNSGKIVDQLNLDLSWCADLLAGHCNLSARITANFRSD